MGSGTLQVRFVCGDLNSGSIIEAGVDGVVLARQYCEEPSCAADINNDGVVNVIDLLEVISNWGASGGPADVNGDGAVNVGDLLEVVGNWGPCS